MQTFLSYAQNFEDVILWRALSGIDNGFYVDVGAQHPLKDSVTRAFYERGWRGINIDPVPAWHGLLKVDRPDDVNLQVAVGEAAGEAVFYEVDETGLSTMDARMAARYSAEGKLVRMSTVEVRTLDSILAEFAPADIHFLKIDVEGAEAQVLAGISLERHRPWIVVVEATLPNTQQDVSSTWEALLGGARYLPAYFDGLNRFFVAEERRDLLRHFELPPNYFDNFVRHPDWEMAELARRLSEEKQSWLAEEASLKEALAAGQRQLVTLEQSLNDELAASRMHSAGLEGSLLQSEKSLRDLQAKHEEALSAHAADLDTIAQLRREQSSAMEEFQRQLEQSRGTADWLASQLRQRNHLIDRVLASRSWKLTAPLRWLSSALGAAHPLEQEHGRDRVPSAAPADIEAVVGVERFVGVPGEQVLLDLASRKHPAAQVRPRLEGELSDPPLAPAPAAHRLDQLMTEARMLLPPPRAVPPRMRSVPGMALFAPYVLRVYERLFRKQALFNAKVIEALQILRDRNG